MMNRTPRAAAAWSLLLLTLIATPVCGQGDSRTGGSSGPLGEPTDGMLMDAARDAWRYVENNTDANTGLVRATPNYANATTWDIGSALAAVYSAHELGIIDDAEYARRMGRMLTTLEGLPLFDGVAYHKVYAVADGRMVDNEGRPDADGYAWSATDLGRFLLWLAVIERTGGEHAAQARRIAQRVNPERIIKEGYLFGEDANRASPFLEGRIGYEQYAARGFEAWGWRAEKALNLMTNAQPVDVWGHRIYKDGRGLDRVVSEPFVMMGLETGWDDSTRVLSERLLSLQEERFRRTGEVTIASEDAVDVPPYYFYYYCIYCNGKPFVIDIHTPGHTMDKPRWVSTKNAFGWHALLPGPYTERAVATVEPARSDSGWMSGVFEGDHRPTGTRDINTAAVILEAALFDQKGGPILPPAAGDGGS